MIDSEKLQEARELAEQLAALLRELDRRSLLDPESLGHLVAARELTEEALERLNRVRCPR